MSIVLKRGPVQCRRPLQPVTHVVNVCAWNIHQDFDNLFLAMRYGPLQNGEAIGRNPILCPVYFQTYTLGKRGRYRRIGALRQGMNKEARKTDTPTHTPNIALCAPDFGTVAAREAPVADCSR